MTRDGEEPPPAESAELTPAVTGSTQSTSTGAESTPTVTIAESTPTVAASTPTVAVVGAGAVGATTALDLAGYGVDVTLFERESVDDRDVDSAPSSLDTTSSSPDTASTRAAGVLYDAYAEDVDAALGGFALDRFREFAATDGFRFTFHDCPYAILVRAGDEERASATRRAVERMQSHGRAVETVSPETLGDRFPSLVTDDLAVAAVAENAGWADTVAFVAAVRGAARDAGVTVRDETTVSLDPDGTTFDAVVVAAGAHTPQVVGSAGLPIKPYRVQALTTRVEPEDDPTAARGSPHPGPMWYDATVGVYARPHPTGLLAGDGTVPSEADPDEWDRTADDWFREETIAVVDHRLGRRVESDDVTDDERRDKRHEENPERHETVETAWAGLCTATPDGDPLLGRVSAGLYVAAGWQGHGFMRAPAHAAVVAALVADDLGVADADPASLPGGETALSAFDPTRFPDDVTFDVREGMVIETE